MLVRAIYPLLFFNKFRTYGKMLCFFLEDEGPIVPRLLKVGDEKGKFAVYKNFRYIVSDDPDCKRTIRFPTGWPRFFQENVDAGLWFSNTAQPLQWKTARAQAKKIGVSPVELDAILDPIWLAQIVRGTQEGLVPEKNWKKSFHQRVAPRI